MTFEERYGIKREVLLGEVRLRLRQREEERLARLAVVSRLERLAREQAAAVRRSGAEPGLVFRPEMAG